MNEKIKQLADEAGLYDDYISVAGVTSVAYSDLERFAELIVRECGVALSPMLRDQISRGRAFDLIKQHFGVE